MKILMITPYLPFPLFSGGQVRSYNLIKNLARDHQIFLVSLIKSEAEKKFIPELEKYCAKVMVFPRAPKPWRLDLILKTGFSLKPFLVVRNFSLQAKKAIARVIKEEKFDLIHAETFYVMPHLPKTKIPILLVEQTIEYLVYDHFVRALPWYAWPLKPLLWLDVLKLRQKERFYWRRADLVAAVSAADRREIRKLAGPIPVRVVPNGVDGAFFAQKVAPKKKFPLVLFVGNLKWLQNREAVEILLNEIWPKLKKLVPQVKLAIVGQHSLESVKTADPDIRVGQADDIRQAYQSAWVFVAPFRSAGGSRLKIFEAMASGLPIVATPKGMAGLNARDGAHFLKGHSSRQLAEKLALLLKDPSLSRRIGLQAKKYIARRYDWAIPSRALADVYQELAHG